VQPKRLFKSIETKKPRPAAWVFSW
jgi:hypothetical protein